MQRLSDHDITKDHNNKSGKIDFKLHCVAAES